jgi:biopolymer transport protein ExbD
MSWKIRHEGSPTAVEGLTLEQLIAGLRQGHWESTDEVMGPGESEWVAIENHPQLGEVAAEMEPPPPRTYDDETHLDMNAMIDVCLVLLVFFILTTSYAALQKQLEAPSVGDKKDKNIKVVKQAEVKEKMIAVRARMENGKPVVSVQDQPVDLDALPAMLRSLVQSSNKRTLLLDHDDLVTQDTVVRIIDAAKGAGVDKIQLQIP